MEKNNEQQELDLFSLLRKIVDFSGNILKKIAGFCGYLLRISFRYYYICLIFLLAAVAYSYYRTSGPRKTYRGELTLGLNDGDVKIYSGMLSSLNRYLLDLDPDGLDRVLQMPEEERGKIGAIDDRFIAVDRDSTIWQAVITVIMSDPDAFPVIKNALVDHFNNNEYLRSINLARIASLKEQERLLEKDIAEIDSLQKIEYFQGASNEAKILLDQKIVFKTDKQMFYNDKLRLLKQKETLIRLMSFYLNFLIELL